MDSGAVVWEAQDGVNTLENKSIFTQGMYGELAYFVQCVLRQEMAVKSSLEFAREVVSVFEAGLLSDNNEIIIPN